MTPNPAPYAAELRALADHLDPAVQPKPAAQAQAVGDIIPMATPEDLRQVAAIFERIHTGGDADPAAEAAAHPDS